MKTEFFYKAEDNLNVAQLCFDNGFYDACANRAYYATLQAAVTALADKGIKRDRNKRPRRKWRGIQPKSDLTGFLMTAIKQQRKITEGQRRAGLFNSV